MAVGVLLFVGAGSGEWGAVQPTLYPTVRLPGTTAQESAPAIRTELDTLSITVGDPLVLTVTVEHDVGSAVVWPDSIDLGTFELLDAVLMEPVRERDRVASTVHFALTAFELGDLEIPSDRILGV